VGHLEYWKKQQVLCIQYFNSVAFLRVGEPLQPQLKAPGLLQAF